LFCIGILTFANTSWAEDKLPLPRFVSLKKDKVNVRRGPAIDRFPIDYIYTRKNLPVEIVKEYDIWRRVRDAEGYEGWVNKVMLSDARYFMVTKNMARLFDKANLESDIVARLEKGVQGQLVSCASSSAFCKVTLNDYSGYVERANIWGVYPNESIED
jgi:SH3-like domain-containing protein